MTFFMNPTLGTGLVMHHCSGSSESGHHARWLEVLHHCLDRGTLKESSS